jgi:hypothetical protein
LYAYAYKLSIVPTIRKFLIFRKLLISLVWRNAIQHNQFILHMVNDKVTFTMLKLLPCERMADWTGDEIIS